MRRLKNAWSTNTRWPQRLEWLEIHNIRGWSGQRVDFAFPIIALVGENGSGKSTILQAAASVYQSPGQDLFASDFFPDTPYEKIESASIRFAYRQGPESTTKTVRKPSNRWRGNRERPTRSVSYIDLRRIQPVSARLGYQQILKRGVTEGYWTAFDAEKLNRLSQIIGKQYSSAGTSITSAGIDKRIPVMRTAGERYSGFHQGAGEVAAAELIASDFPRYGLILIDEIETSLHPRAQRRLIRDLAHAARLRELQIILTTHSPYVLEELPPEARVYLMDGVEGKMPVLGVSPEFAMTTMDEENHPEADVFVEDARAATLIEEIVVSSEPNLRARIQIVPFGAAGVGQALGQMVANGRFPRPSVVFLDGDQELSPGCLLLPGDDAPERVVFECLCERGWAGIPERLGRPFAQTVDALNAAMANNDHHTWVLEAANRITIGSDILWQALAHAWVVSCVSEEERAALCDRIRDSLAA